MCVHLALIIFTTDKTGDQIRTLLLAVSQTSPFPGPVGPTASLSSQLRRPAGVWQVPQAQAVQWGCGYIPVLPLGSFQTAELYSLP